MGETTIEWASHTWNPYTWDCTKVSPGCKNCYMMAMADRFGKPLVGSPKWRGAAAWKELKGFPVGAVIFVNSMSDTYHESVPAAWIHSIHNTAMLHPDKTFLILTKRPERVYGMRHLLAWPKNLWLGTSVENEDYLWRLNFLLRVPAAGHFVSAEPLIGSLRYLETYLSDKPGVHKGLGWVIVGGESGNGRREFNKDWAREIRDMCIRRGVPFLYKQGGAFKSGQDRVLDNRTWDETPFEKAA